MAALQDSTLPPRCLSERLYQHSGGDIYRAVFRHLLPHAVASVYQILQENHPDDLAAVPVPHPALGIVLQTAAFVRGK